MDFEMLFYTFWEPNCIKKTVEILDAFLEAREKVPPHLWGRPGGMCRSLGGIIGGYEDPKIARTRAKEIQIGI